MSAASTGQWGRGAVLCLLVLVLLTPVFGWASGAVGYAEPLENAAEATGASDDTRTIHPGLFPDYAVPGLGFPLGTLVSAAAGTALAMLVAFGAGRLLER